MLALSVLYTDFVTDRDLPVVFAASLRQQIIVTCGTCLRMR